MENNNESKTIAISGEEEEGKDGQDPREELTDFEHKLFYLGVIDVNNIEQNILRQADEQIFPRSLQRAPLTFEEQSLAQQPMEPKLLRSIEQRIIDKIEYAQLMSAIPCRPTEANNEVFVQVSKTGVKLVETKTLRVVERLALHKIVQVIAYDDDNEYDAAIPPAYNVLLLVKRKNYSEKGGEQCHMLQSPTPEGSNHVCQQVRNAFGALEADLI